MSKVDVVTPNRSRQTATAPGLQARTQATPPAYDSDQVPVLMRLPDLSVTSSAGLPANPASLSADKERRRHRSRSASSRMAESDPVDQSEGDVKDEYRRPSRSQSWMAVSSQAVVVLILLAITVLAYLLIQGKSGSGEKQNTLAESTSPRAPEVTQDQPELELWPAGTAAAMADSTGSEPPLMSGGVPEPEDTSSTMANGQMDITAPAVASSPVQSWPPGMGGDAAGGSANAADVTTSPGTSWPAADGSQRSAELPANWPAETAEEAATLNGTVEIPQPRVDNERTPSGIY